MSKTISFFLASSIRDVEYDRKEIGDFVNQMNNMYQPMDVFIRLYKCEDESMDHSIVLGGSQKSLDDLIRESDICFVLFWHKAGKVTQHELEVAFEAYKAHNKPKVVVYFKTIENKDEVPDDIKQVMLTIDKEMKHYHREYSHIDSLKLGIITQLNVFGFIKTDLTVEDNQIKAHGQTIASTTEIPLFSENEEYMELIARYHESVDKCESLLSQYNMNKNNTKVYLAYQKASKERNRISEDLADMANGMISIGNNIAKIASSTEVNERIRNAIKCFDSGDYAGVLEILNPEEIENQIIVLNEMDEQVLIKRRTLIEELRLRILALEAQGKWNDIYSAYEKAIELVIDRPEMPKSIVIDYIRYLDRQGKLVKSIEKCEWLKNYFSLFPDSTTYLEKFELFELLGRLYFESMKYDDAEIILKQSIDLVSGIPDCDFEVFGAKVLLAKVYFKVNRHFEAESLYMDALDFYKKHDSDGIQPVDILIADTSLELGDLYYMINRHEDAGNLFIDAYYKYRELVNHGDNRYRASMAKACDKAARLALSVFSHRKSDRYYIESLRVKDTLTQKDPSEYFNYFIRICDKLGTMWLSSGDNAYANSVLSEANRVREKMSCNEFSYIEKEEYHPLDLYFYKKPINKALLEQLCRDAKNVYTVLSEENPEAYEHLLAQSLNTLGAFYSQTGESSEAEKIYYEAVSLRELLARRAPQFRSDLAASYSNLAYHYYLTNDFEQSEHFYLQAIKIYVTLSKKDAGAYSNDLARNYNYLANLYSKISNKSKAEYYYHESLLIYFELYKRSPRAFVDRIINTVANVVALFDEGNLEEWMQEFLYQSDKTLV